MKKSFLDIVEEALVNVDEVDCIQLKHAKDNEEDFILIDSREREEWDASRIPNSVHMSKGLIEKMVEANIPDRDTKLVILLPIRFSVGFSLRKHKTYGV